MDLIGRKIRGFKFGGFMWDSKKENLIGEIGEIILQESEWVEVRFESDSSKWYYPLPEALEHLVEEEPIIPELKGVEMEVSDDGKNWYIRTVICQYNSSYLTECRRFWKHARPIPVKKLTMEELEKIVGFKFEIV